MELLGHTSLRMMEKVYWHREAEAQSRAAALAGGHVAPEGGKILAG